MQLAVVAYINVIILTLIGIKGSLTFNISVIMCCQLAIIITSFFLYVVLGDNHDSPSDGVIYFNTTSSFFDLVDLVKGRNGRDGRDGWDGKDGEKGPQGEKGEQGAVGPQGPTGPAGPSVGGVVFTRWGRSICPSTPGTKLVYDGIAAKSYHSDKGGGINYQCLPKDPQYLTYYSSVSTYRGYMYGVEYHVHDGPLSSLHLHGVPCAVCLTYTRGIVLMIPGKYTCPRDWTREYYGYLMAERHNHENPSTFECIDSFAESIIGTGTHTPGGILMHVESRCPNPLCPPYVDGKELTCAVCTI